MNEFNELEWILYKITITKNWDKKHEILQRFVEEKLDRVYRRKDKAHAEVKRLREWKAEVERICRTMNGPNRDTALFIMTNKVEEE
tara:strand:+ start:73 stop:330 length:258 start_codon:yes stop_codon:yes gene_type:complete